MSIFMMSLGFVAVLVSTLLIYAAYLLFFAFTLWMAVDAAKQDSFWWVVIVLGIPVAGSLAYYFTEKKHEYAKAPSHHIHTSETEVQHETSPHKREHHLASNDVNVEEKGTHHGEEEKEKKGE